MRECGRSERAGRAVAALLRGLERVRGRAGRRGDRGAGLGRADHDARAFLEIAGRDLRLLPVGDAELHEVRRERTLGVHGPELRHAAGLRAGRTRATWCVAARAAGESAREAAAVEATRGRATRRGARRGGAVAGTRLTDRLVHLRAF